MTNDIGQPTLLDINGFVVSSERTCYTDMERLSSPDLWKVVLDTNVLLNAQHSRVYEEALIATWDPQETVYVVPTIVWAEIATKTHPESYERTNNYAQSMQTAASQLFLRIAECLPWPRRIDPPLCVVALRQTDQIMIAIERLKTTERLLWREGRQGRQMTAVPAMADHQVVRTACALKAQGHKVQICTADEDARDFASRRGVLDERFLENLRDRREYRGDHRKWRAPHPNRPPSAGAV